jgi:hypothetical protein
VVNAANSLVFICAYLTAPLKIACFRCFQFCRKPMPYRPAYYAIFVGGGIAGTLDILYAITYSAFRGMMPERLLQLIASGLLGNEAYSGGLPVAALGLTLHVVIAISLAAVYWVTVQRFQMLSRYAMVSGMIYGMVIFVVMNFVVLPLSAFPHPFRFSLVGTGTNFLAHVFLVGVPIALAARKALYQA